MVALAQPVGAQPAQRPAHKPAPPIAVQPLQPPSPSAGESQRPPQQKPSAANQPAGNEQRGTEDRPVVVKVLPSEKTETERAQEQHDRFEKSSSDWWIVRLTGALALVGILQFLALIGQAIVFRIQANALRESVDLTREVSGHQERDMRASIAEASRAATAMDKVVTSIQTMTDEQREFWQRQMRAYVFIQTINIFNVAAPPTPTPDGQQVRWTPIVRQS